MLADAKLEKAVIELLYEKPANRLTIKDICERAKVSRPSFYYHFSGIGDLLWESIKPILFDDRPHFAFDLDSWVRDYQRRSERLSENHTVVRSIHASKYRDEVFDKVSALTHIHMLEMVRDISRQTDQAMSDSAERFYAQVYAFLHMGYIVRFAKSGEIDSTEAATRKLRALSRDPVIRAISLSPDSPDAPTGSTG